MPQIDLTPLKEIDGFVAAALIDLDTGLAMYTIGDEAITLDRAAAGNSQAYRAKKELIDTLEPDERIAQLIITPYIQGVFSEVEELSDTERGEGGFGSTGTK